MKRALLFRYSFILIGVYLLSCHNLYAIQSIRYLGIEQGLSNNAVTSIYKDKHGFVWIGTYDGLNKYDGSTVRIYRNIWGDNRSLNDNHINKITGFGNDIFIGTQKGLVQYCYNQSKFSPVFYYSKANKKPQRLTYNIDALQAGKNGNIYIGTDYEGLFIYSQANKLCRRVALNGANTKYTVQSIAIDTDGKIWLFIRNVGLCLLNKQENTIRVINSELKYANCILFDPQKKIWIGTDNGLFNYNLSTNTLARIGNSTGKLNSDNIIDVKLSRSGEIWIGTNGGGVNVLDSVHHTTKYIVSGKENGNSLRSDAISMLYEDDEARIWIATLRGGVNFLDNNRNQFKLVTNNPFNSNSIVNNFILSFCEDEKHNIWIGTDGGGLSYWDRKNNQYHSYIHSNDKASLRSNFVVSVINDRQNQVWVALFNGGIDRFDKQSQKFIHYDCFNTFTKSADKNLWKLYLDSHNNLWAGATRGGALYLYNRAKDKFEVFDDQLINIHALFEDHNGVLWAGDYLRLIKIDVAGKKHLYYNVKNAVRSITEDTQHNLWIGTEGGGLLKYDPSRRLLHRYTQLNGLPSNSLLNVLVDNKDNIWASTYNGLTEFNKQTKTFSNFYASDGLQSNQFNFNAALKLQSGELAFGGINGFNIFYPDSIALRVHQPELKFTGLHVNNRSIEADTSYTGNQAIVDLKKITVPYDEATLAIDYTAPEYSFPDKLKYAYYLDGWDHGWNEVGALKTAYYTRLNEGSYTLRVKATNTAGSWGEHQLALQIVVLPPWYRTWLAYFVYACLIAAILYWVWLYRIRQTKFKYELQIANLQVEREKEVNEKKLAFFTNVSHEFRTPLTLIINPIKDLIRDNNTKNKDELNTIYRNARRLLGLVDHLLLFRKAESENDSLNLSNVNLSVLCHDVYLCFLQQAKNRNITYRFESNNQQIVMLLDREKMEIAIFNLISNALKFTSEGGEISINLNEIGDQISLTVVDDGCGIAADTGDKLFDKFYQIKDTKSLKTGFGIGLYLVKNFIESHGGIVNYRNNDVAGTTFTILLPYKVSLESYFSDQPDNQHLINELINEDQIQSASIDEDAGNLELLISERQSVLIIDDNAEIRTYIKKIFKDNYKIYEAQTGEKGLELIKRHLPDVVISDITMEEVSGIDLCRMIKQDSSLSHIPVILLTGDPNPETKLKGIEVGAVDFVSKPFEKDMLIARVQGILRDRRELQNYFYNEVTLKSNTRNISEHHKEFLYKCIAIIENYIIDPNFDVKTIADDMGISYSSLFKKIKSISGQSVNSFVRFVRLRKAAEMMINTNCNVNEAALNAGFNDIKYFREHFIKLFGIKPSEFIKQHRSAFNKTYLVEQDFIK
ncbi:response regulator [Inquilinus sp. KBS0705]|nr:response regulator [Inquilinus sp. KBS0705]